MQVRPAFSDTGWPPQQAQARSHDSCPPFSCGLPAHGTCLQAGPSVTAHKGSEDGVLASRLLSCAQAADVDTREPEPEELGRVRGVVAEADAPGYWFHASKDGSRESHYR
jgi:hypothetical protein